jgi:hypothetical protein
VWDNTQWFSPSPHPQGRKSSCSIDLASVSAV